MNGPRYVEDLSRIPGLGPSESVAPKVKEVVDMILARKDGWVEVPAKYLDPKHLYNYGKRDLEEGFFTMRGVAEAQRGDRDSYFVSWTAKPWRRQKGSKKTTRKKQAEKRKQQAPEPEVLPYDGWEIQR